MRKPLITLFIAALTLLTLGGGIPAKAIINGKAATPGQFPFMAAIQDRDDFTFCGGSVIANDWVLTAAHCMFDLDGNAYKPADLQVATGRTDLADTSTGQVSLVDEIRVHPNWDGTSYDVAVMHLVTPTASPAIQLAGSADNDLEADGTPVVVAGWGDQLPTLGLFATNDLRYTNLKVVNDNKCANRNFMFDFQAATGVCAGELGTDSCNGDSGGPLWGVKNGVKVQIGVVSYGLSCGVPDHPGVYSEVNNTSISSFIATALASR